ncbi:MAG: acyl transferase [Bacteroidia bacterium]
MSRPFVMKDVWNIHKQDFNEFALEMFQFQAKNNKVYAEYLQLIGKSPNLVNKIEDIPYLPIRFFKTHEIKSWDFTEEMVFESSSTTGIGTSRHLVHHLSDYHLNSEKIFEERFGSISQFKILGLLPNYLEKGQSSLVNMVSNFAKGNSTKQDPFYLYNHEALAAQLKLQKPTVLFGVSFALLDFIQEYEINNPELIVIETGGMKGRKSEMTKLELYDQLKLGFPNAQIHSEYGMTELMSQAYTSKSGLYNPPNWLNVNCRAENDPFSNLGHKQRGALNIIDLANIHSCAFLATDDLGRVYEDGSFEVLGRIDHSDLRGCSLLIS